MNGAFQFVRKAAAALWVCTVLAACGSGSGTPGASSSPSSAPSGLTWNGAPTGPAERVAAGKSATGSFDLTKWTINNSSDSSSKGTFALAPRNPHTPAQFSLTGTGAAVAEEIFSPPVRVAPGSTYVFAATVDASKVTSGANYLWISNVSRNHLYGSAQVSAGERGRFGFTVRIPQGVRKVRVGFYTGGSRVKQGARLTFADPALTKISR